MIFATFWNFCELFFVQEVQRKAIQDQFRSHNGINGDAWVKDESGKKFITQVGLEVEGIVQQEHQLTTVYDLGGGTFNVSILNLAEGW